MRVPGRTQGGELHGTNLDPYRWVANGQKIKDKPESLLL